MTTRYKKFLMWFIRFGKIKARVIHFLFLITICSLVFVLLDFVLGKITGTPFSIEWENNLSFSFFFLVCAPFVSWRFYDVALMQLKEYRMLEKKGLTPTDLSRIAFVRRWERKRRKGLTLYCLFEGGLILGIFLLFPVSFLLFFSLKQYDKPFYTLVDIIVFVVANILLSFTIGLIIFRFKWSYNQRRFRRLTNPVI
jgi:hypothetical protein